MMPTLKIDRTPPTAQELAAMYMQAGWITEVDAKIMETAVGSGSEWFIARNEDGFLLGIGRLITDYARYAFIVDVIIDEAHQRQGIGTAIMTALINLCQELGVKSVNLWPSKGKVDFYKGLGFYSLPADQPHMKLRDS